MTRAFLLALASAVGVVASAVPLPREEAERLAVARAFGAWTDPVGDCAYRFANGRVCVLLPAYPRSATEWLPGPLTPPRFQHEIAGDFTASVRVEVPHQPDGRLGVQNPGGSRFVAAGLTARDAAGNRAGVRKFEKMDNGFRTVHGSAWGKANAGGGGSGTGGQKDADPRLFLRLSRTGPTATFATSTDGVTWRDYGKQDLGWGGPVTLGLIAENTTGTPVEVTFDQFKLDRPKK